MTKTNRQDVIANFVRYHSRQPNADELKPGGLIDYLTTKAPNEVEVLLAKNSPITKGMLWGEYNKTLVKPTPVSPTTTPPATTPRTNGNWVINQETGIGTNDATGQTMPIQTPNPNVNAGGVLKTPPTPETPAGTPGVTTPTQVTGITAEQKKAITDMLDADFKDLTPTERSFIEATFLNSDTYTSGKTIPTSEQISGWVRDAATQSAADVNPYYTKITAQELEDYKNQMADIRNSATRYGQQEASNYKKTLADTKQNLRARGLTFSGTSRATLGKETAIGAEGGYNAGLEGSVPMNRRLNWEDKLAGYQQSARDIGTAAERELGSTEVAKLNGVDNTLMSPYDLKSGSLDYQAGRTQELYTPHQATSGGYAGLNETPAAGQYTSTHELQRLKDMELAKQQRLQQKSLII